MTPRTVTETVNDQSSEPVNSTQANITPCSISSYDEAMPKNDPKFMAPIRNWEKRMGFKTPLMWTRSIIIVIWHLVTVIWSAYNIYTLNLPSLKTVIFSFIIGGISGFGVTGGAHRLWCHRSYKAKWPLQVILMLCYSVAGQNDIYDWVRDHRVHHKHSETSADPHDSQRGFFFSHVGWLMMKKHPDITRQGSKIDLSDITNDALIMFHVRHFAWFKILLCFVIPTIIPPLVWGECWSQSILSQIFLRYVCSLNCTWAVNSFAHIWGNRPYDQYIKPVENWGVALVAMGEGWHNYHHTFPWDYKAAELGYGLNLTTLLLDGFAKIGWAYDLKEASPTLVKTVSDKRGEKKRS